MKIHKILPYLVDKDRFVFGVGGGEVWPTIAAIEAWCDTNCKGHWFIHPPMGSDLAWVTIDDPKDSMLFKLTFK